MISGKAAFRWTPQREMATQLLAEDELTDEQIVRTVGVCRRTLGYGKKPPEVRGDIDRRVRASMTEWVSTRCR